MVGDANQAIYGFRGASPANISQFSQDFPGATILPLSKNYRSRPDLVTLAEAFRCQHLEIGQQPGKNQPARSLVPEQIDVTLAVSDDDEDEVAGIFQDIRRKLAAGYRYSDIVILCRTRSQVQKFARAIADAELPVIERGGLLDQEHIKDVLSLLLLLTDESGKGLLRAARQPEHFLSQEDIEAIILAARQPQLTTRQLIISGETPAGISDTGQEAFLRLSQTLQALAPFNAPSLTSDIWTLIAQYLFLESGQIRRELLQSAKSGTSPLLADYDRLLQLARHYDQQQAQEARQAENYPAQTQAEHIVDFLEYLSLLVLLRQDGGSRQGNSESEEETPDILRVMTVHASKGLEFPVVYLPELVQQRFPLRNQGSSVSYPKGMLPAEAEGKRAHESGESCLFYVGVTRARDHLILSHSERYGKRAYKRSHYLDALEAGIAPERLIQLRWDEQRQTDESKKQGMRAISVSSQPSLDFVNAMRPPTLSTSVIESYLRCPRQYAYSNIYHFASEPDGYRLFWQTTQKLIDEMHQHFQMVENNDEQPPIKAPSSTEIQERYTQHWQEIGGHEEPFAPMYEQHGQEIVETIRRKLTIQDGEKWDLHQSFAVEIAGTTVHVTVDRVEMSTSEEAATRFVRTRIRGKKQQEKPEADIRELFYTLAYRQEHPGQDVELYSLNMSTGESFPLKLSTKKEQSLYESALEAIEGLERNDYPARPAKPFHCPQCPFFFICPA